MKFLFVHQNFPGQFLHIIRHLIAQRRHEVVFITEPNQNFINGVRKVPYRKPAPPPETTHWTVRELDLSMRRAEVVAATATSLKNLGFTPDIIIGHHGWGELLNLCDVWPDVPILGYFEFFYQTVDSDVGFDPEFPVPPGDFPRIRAKNAVNLLALSLNQAGQTPTVWQHSTYPDWARPKIEILPEGVDLTTCKPNPTIRRRQFRIGDTVIRPEEKLVTYVARDLEPYRGCHIMLRALPRLLAKRKDVRVVMVGGDGTSYGAAPAGTTWKRLFLDQLGDRLDLDRVLFPGRIPYELYLQMLQRSDAHVYLTYPFVASWSLRESLAMGCPVIGSDTVPVQEFIQDGQNGLLTPFFDHDRLADTILTVLEDAPLARRLSAGAVAWAERNLGMPAYLAAYEGLIARTVGTGDLGHTAASPAPQPFDARAPAPTSSGDRPPARKAARHASKGHGTKRAKPAVRPGGRRA
ncbi:glycosyltransferase family 4 protein [Acidisphaera rubrifaciens]|uniref:Glycosyl transferase n=1 Tax=Acidisphaera rubrifaciens HS-AP3 TaxID=1231350 RepID=A0A0D6P665_9PROT|nr:glycosyltransferase family 4 protein [Acidisphaera rubrifaciens]GAN76688.1 glycosyl transferase [Acidisphaera rubrifaciens HS-AP3]